MNAMKIKLITLLIMLLPAAMGLKVSAAEYKHDIYVNQDGSGDYTTITEALEGIRAYMDYTVTVHIANGTYKEKIIIPSWLKNVSFIGEDPEKTVITFDHHANIDKMGTFRTYTVRVDANDVLFKNLTIENNAPQLGQAVALHTEGDKIRFVNCRFLGNQDTIFTGGKNARLYFADCYIEGTTDFIFGPATAYFKNCDIFSKRDSYITAASTPGDVRFGYIFDSCKLRAADNVKKVYLGRPWRPYAHTVFINCEMGSHIRPEGWHNWNNADNERTARYGEYGSHGPGAAQSGRVGWAMNITDADAAAYRNLTEVFSVTSGWDSTE